jgi:PKD repeat protein
LDKIVIKQWRWWRLAGVLLAVIWLGCLLVAIPVSANTWGDTFSVNDSYKYNWSTTGIPAIFNFTYQKSALNETANNAWMDLIGNTTGSLPNQFGAGNYTYTFTPITVSSLLNYNGLVWCDQANASQTSTPYSGPGAGRYYIRMTNTTTGFIGFTVYVVTNGAISNSFGQYTTTFPFVLNQPVSVSILFAPPIQKWYIGNATTPLTSEGSASDSTFTKGYVGLATQGSGLKSVSAFYVNESPIASFTLTNASSVAVNTNLVTCNQTGYAFGDPGVSVTWDWGDGTLTHTINGSHTYTLAGIYSVNLTDMNVANTSIQNQTKLITVYAAPSSSFTMQNTTGQGQRYATFTDTSSGPANQWNWSFQNVTGNNTQVWWSQAQNPTLLFPPGNYSIVLNATNPAGVSISPAQRVNVSAVSAAFSGTPVSGVSPLTTTFTDSSTGLPSSFAWFFGDETYTQPWSQLTSNGGYLPRWGQGAVVMPDGSIIMAGGKNLTKSQSDVWRSINNGATWSLQTANAGFGARNYFSEDAMPDGSIVMMGGENAILSPRYNDTWRSTDEGQTWTELNASSGWLARDSFSNVVMSNGDIILMGGCINNASNGVSYPFSQENDVWKSSNNGSTWVQQTAGAGWVRREHPNAVVLSDGNIVLMGGLNWNLSTPNAFTYFNDTWRSTNEGVTWSLQNASGGWTARTGIFAVAMPDNSIVIGGGGLSDTGGSNLNDTWRSTDEGQTWTQINASSGWIGRGYMSGVSMPDGSIVLMAGYNSASNILNDTWRMQPVGSSAQNPSHTYVNTGGSPVTYNVSETVWNAASGYNTLLKSNYIAQNSLGPIASFTQNITQGYSPLVVQFSDTSSYGTSNFWNFGDGTNATSTQFPVHTYTSTGQYTVTLTETNSYGSSTATGKVLVNVIATPTPTPTPTPQTNNLSVWKRIA